MEKVVGSEGVFATNPRTNAVRAILNADSPANAVGPYSSDAGKHNAHVLEYFLGAGLPRDQVGEPHVLTMMTAIGATSEPEANMKKQLVAYTTVLSRRIEGVLLPDSFAQARFNANGEVTMEWIYWPPIPRSAVDEAHRLQAIVSTPSTSAEFVNRLPIEARGLPSEVTIRHSDFDDESGFTAFASYDVHISRGDGGAGRAATRNFLIDGSEIIHPNRRFATTKDTLKP